MKKKLLLTSILSVIMCVSLIAGATFALFTSKATVNIAVTSGKVNVVAEITDVTYSYDSRLTGESDCTYIVDADGVLNIEKMLPGDTVKANIKITNNSDVTIKYRVQTAISGVLADYLEIQGVEKAWTLVAAGGTIDTESVSITLPYDVEDLDAHAQKASVAITVEAIQGNASVANVGSNNETTTETAVKGDGAEALVPAGAKMKDGEKTLTLNVEEDTANAGSFDISGAEGVFAYDIEIPEIADDNEEAIIITIPVPANLSNVMMFHEGEEMTIVATKADVNEHNEYFYDAAGSITFATKSFSNYTIIDDYELVKTADELVAALESGKSVKFANDIKIDPANMSNAYGTTGINVKNGQTIDGSGFTLDVKGAGGTWDSGINTTGGLIKDITVTGSFRGIFVNHNSTYFETVKLEKVIIKGTTYTISCDQGENQNLVATDCEFYGWTSFAATLGTAKFVDCKFAEGNGYAYCRPYAVTEFVGCEFAAGYQLDARATTTFAGCKLGGVDLTAENLATLVTGNFANASVK